MIVGEMHSKKKGDFHPELRRGKFIGKIELNCAMDRRLREGAYPRGNAYF